MTENEYNATEILVVLQIWITEASQGKSELTVKKVERWGGNNDKNISGNEKIDSTRNSLHDMHSYYSSTLLKLNAM